MERMMDQRRQNQGSMSHLGRLMNRQVDCPSVSFGTMTDGGAPSPCLSHQCVGVERTMMTAPYAMAASQDLTPRSLGTVPPSFRRRTWTGAGPTLVDLMRPR